LLRRNPGKKELEPDHNNQENPDQEKRVAAAVQYPLENIHNEQANKRSKNKY
jgi:hypothetical protein